MMMPTSYVYPRIALLMFLQFFAVGSWIVTLGYYMSHTLHFGHIVGPAYGMFGLAAVLSSLFAGLLADHYFSTEKLVGCLMLGAAAALMVLVRVDHGATGFLVNMLALTICVTAVTPLAASLAMSMLDDPVTQFPSIRAFGTGGWIVAGLAIGLQPGAAATTTPMMLAAAIYLVSGLYCFTLPNVPPGQKGRKIHVASALGLDILRGGADRTLLVFFACLLAAAIPAKFYDSLFNTFLAEKSMRLELMGVTVEPTGIQTLGQIVEMATLLLLAPMIARLGFKRTMVVGIVAWVARYVLFAYGFEGEQPIKWRILLGILMHGLSYDFLFVTGQLWLETRLGPAMRNRAQSLYSFIYNGAGVVVGSNIAGMVFSHFTAQTGGRNWWAIWLVPAACAAVTLAYFIFNFNERSSANNRLARLPQSP